MSPDVDNQPSTYLRNIPEEGRLDNTVAEAWDFIITLRKQNKKKKTETQFAVEGLNIYSSL